MALVAPNPTAMAARQRLKRIKGATGEMLALLAFFKGCQQGRHIRGNNIIYSRKAAKDAKKPTPGILCLECRSAPHQPRLRSERNRGQTLRPSGGLRLSGA